MSNYSLDCYAQTLDSFNQRLEFLEAKAKVSDDDRLLNGLQVEAFYGITKPTRIEWIRKGFLVPVTVGTGARKYYRYSELKQRP